MLNGILVKPKNAVYISPKGATRSAQLNVPS
jgi:hypothetical protein